jgi:periplasmic copper chaperone A
LRFCGDYKDMRTNLLRTAAGLTVFGAVVLGAATAASAHVTVSAPGAVSGGSDQLITFRVPTESISASTVGLQVLLPTSTPIASVLVAPHYGWTDSVTTIKLAKPIVTDDGDITDAVSTITWKADAPSFGIKPGQFDQFVIIAGQLPVTNSLTFKAIQTYSDKSVVSWIQTDAPGSTAELDHPAPVLSLTPTVTTSTALKTTASSSTSGTVGVILGALGLVLGGTALVLVLRRKAPAAS